MLTGAFILRAVNNDQIIRGLLHEFHQHVGRRQGLLQKEAMQLVNPKMLERFVRLEGIPPQAVDQQIAKWLQQVSQFVSPDQITRLVELKDHHMREREQMMAERSQINKEIKARTFLLAGLHLLNSEVTWLDMCRSFIKKRWLANV